MSIVSFIPSVTFVLDPTFGELDTATHGTDIAAEFPFTPIVFCDTQLIQLTLNSLALVGPQPATGRLMAACRDVLVNKLTIEAMRGSEFSTQFVCQPAEGDRAKTERLNACHAVY